MEPNEAPTFFGFRALPLSCFMALGWEAMRRGLALGKTLPRGYLSMDEENCPLRMHSAIAVPNVIRDSPLQPKNGTDLRLYKNTFVC
jgi:hypothetical protein